MEGVHALHFHHSSPPSAPEMAAGGDQFVVEDLLDFCDEEEEEEGGDCWCSEAGPAGHSTDDSSTITAVESCGNSLSVSGQHIAGDLAFRGFADDVLCGPQDDQAELEWLSNFVEESFSSEDLLTPNFISISNATTSTSFAEVTAEISATTRFPNFRHDAAVPAKARSKRSRPVLCSWISQLDLFSPSLTTVSSPKAETFSSLGAAQENKTTKMTKKTHVAAATAARTGVRRCLHCKAEKTPQWRAGPMGPKTLCNACGVRYKSGRLVPEYRPAVSPTFVPSRHSNSHRKVIELRREKDLQQRAGGITSAYGVGAGKPAGDCFLHRHGRAAQTSNISCDGAGRVAGHGLLMFGQQ